MSYVGDIRTNQVLKKKFTTVNTSGVPTSFTGTPILAAYKNDSVLQTLTGITVTVDFDGIVGLHNVVVDLSQDTSFYAAATDVDLVILAGTVSASSLSGYNPISFSIENRTSIQNATERNAIADAFLDRDMSTGTDSGSGTVRTPRQALRFLRNKWTIISGALSVKKENDSTESWSATVGTTTNTDGITSLDPAGP